MKSKKEKQVIFDEIEVKYSEFLINKKSEFVKKSAIFICSYLNDFFYEWTPDDNPYDYSGEIVKTELLNKDKAQTLLEFLDFYTGGKDASYQSGRGWNYRRVSDELWDFINELVFGEYLEIYIKEANVYLGSFNLDLEGEENLRDYFNFNDVVGDSNITVHAYLEEFFKSIDLSLLKEIAEK
jgi:hypothetical protein